jgi:hypothetical protein
LKSFRGKKPKKLDSTIARQIDENYQDTNNTIDQSPLSNDVISKVSTEVKRPSQIKFVVDNMLHGLGKELRVAGCDTVILEDDDPHTDAIRVSEI